MKSVAATFVSVIQFSCCGKTASVTAESLILLSLKNPLVKSLAVFIKGYWNPHIGCILALTKCKQRGDILVTTIYVEYWEHTYPDYTY